MKPIFNMTIAIMILTAFPAAALAADCKSIRDPAGRLACFDAAPKKKPAVTKTAPSVGAEQSDPVSRTCILKAAETLPSIPGLVVKQSKIKSVETPANWPAGSPAPIVVDVDFVAAGQAETYSYLCAVSPNGQTIVQRLAR